MSVPLLLAEFVMIYQLVADIPAEFSNKQAAAEVLRRVQETLDNYVSPASDDEEDMDREKEFIEVRYSTPYENMTMVHMELWNELVMDAIKSPPTLNKKFAEGEQRLADKEIIFTNW